MTECKYLADMADDMRNTSDVKRRIGLAKRKLKVTEIERIKVVCFCFNVLSCAPQSCLHRSFSHLVTFSFNKGAFLLPEVGKLQL